MPEPIFKTIQKWLSDNRRFLFWSGSILLLLWLMIQLKELTSLIFASYFLALLLDPLVSKMEKLSFSRSFSLVLLLIAGVAAFLGFIALAVPAILKEYHNLASQMPQYIEVVSEKIKPLAAYVPNFDWENLKHLAKDIFSAIGSERLAAMGKKVSEVVLNGYSFTLTIVNLTLLPFFVFYLVRDLDKLHNSIGSFLPTSERERVSTLGNEILDHFIAFFKGQLTVSALMAVLYVIGLSIAGLPSAIAIGVIAGFLNIVPYLGLAIGIVLALVVSLVNELAFLNIVGVLGVFGFVQFIEGTVLTPKIVGESVGIHPLAVIIALIAFGQLFGLVGMIIAIPAAAALRVLFNHTLEEIEKARIVSHKV